MLKQYPSILLFLLLSLVACGNKREIVIAIATATPVPTETLVPTAVPATAVPTPTATALPPTPTPLPMRALPPGEVVAMEGEVVTISAEWETFASGNQAYRLEWDPQGRLVQVGSSGLSYWNPTTNAYERLTRDDGLPSTTLRAYAETPNGDRWVATRYGGLGHWNGVEWQRYTARHGLPHNSVRDLLVDHAGTVWVATVGGLMTIRDGVFQTHSFPNADNELWSLYEDNEGFIWVGSHTGIARWDGVEWRHFDTADGVPQQRVREFTQASDGAIWAASQNTVLRFDGESWASMSTFASGANVQTVFAASDGRVWVGLLNPPTVVNEDIRYFADNAWTTPTTAPIRGVLSITEDADGNLYMGSFAHGTWRFDGETWTPLAASDEFLGGSLYDVALAPDGRHVVSSDSGEIAQLVDGSLQLLQPTDGFLVSRERRPVAVMPDGDVWVGSLNSGLFRYRDGQWQQHTAEDGLANDKINALAVTEEGALWVASGPVLSTLVEEEWQHHAFEVYFPYDTFADIALDNDDAVWGYGRIMLRVQDGETESIQYNIGNLGPQAGCGCSHIAMTEEGQLWVANGTSVAPFDPDNMTPGWGIDLGLPNTWFNGIDAGPNNTLWVSTGDRGVYIMQSGKVVAHLDSADGLASDTVYKTQFAPDGSIWLATQGGLSRLAQMPEFDQAATTNIGTWETFTNSADVVDFAFDGDVIWAATRGGVLRWESADAPPHRYTTLDGLGHNNLWEIEVCGDLVVVAGDAGAFRYEAESDSWLPFNQTGTRETALTYRVLACYPNGEMLLAHYSDAHVYADGDWFSLEFSVAGRVSNFSRAVVNPAAETIWLAESRNIVRAFGRKAVGLPPEEMTWLEGDSISSMAVELDDTLWVGTSRGVLGRWRDDSWTLFSAETVPDFPANVVQAINILPNGHLLLSALGTVFQFDPITQMMVEPQLPSDYPEGVLTKVVFKDDKIYAISDRHASGVNVFDGATWAKLPQVTQPSIGHISAVAEDKWGNVWVLGNPDYRVTPDGEWQLIDRQTVGVRIRGRHLVATEEGVWFGGDPMLFFDGENWTEYPLSEGNQSLSISAMAVDDSGQLWLATNLGVAIWEDEQLTFLTDEETFPSSVQRLIPDGERMWVGLHAKLTFIEDRQPSSYLYEDHSLGTSSMIKLPDGDLLLGVGGSVSMFDPETDGIRPIPELFDSMQSAFVGEDGSLWIGSQSSGVFHFNGERWRRLTPYDGLPDNRISTIFVDSQNRVWFGGAAGLSVYTP